MARQDTSYIVIHCSQTRPSQDIGAKDIDRWHRERGWLKIGYARVIKRDGNIKKIKLSPICNQKDLYKIVIRIKKPSTICKTSIFLSSKTFGLL